jgi:hypothetical protein
VLIPKRLVRSVGIVTMLQEIVVRCSVRFATAIPTPHMTMLTVCLGIMDLSCVLRKLKGIASFILMKLLILRSLEKEPALL